MTRRIGNWEFCIYRSKDWTFAIGANFSVGDFWISFPGLYAHADRKYEAFPRD